jgi:enoyl-CoA hydratase/carnithine racemase
MSDRVTINVGEQGVADVRMNRPEKRNALDTAMFAGLRDAGEQLKAMPNVRVVVLSGEGASFCAGLDFSSFNAMASGDRTPAEPAAQPEESPSTPTSGGITHLGQQVAWVWQELPVPVIAAVHGFALGGGIQLALGADIRFVTPDVELSVLEIKWGLVPDMTGTQALVNLVGLDVAKELTFTGRKVRGTEAVELGLATHLADDPRAAALELAAEIASKSPHAVRAAKRLLNNAPKLSLAEGFAAERDEIGRLIGTPNQVESVMAGFEKRAPRFADPT